MRHLWLVALLGVATCPLLGAAQTTQVAIFAGGCFWCLEAAFEADAGVIAAEPGYIGGSLEYPADRDVASQTTGHYEAVRVTFDPSLISYRQLLVAYWLSVDPTDPDGQFCERGPSKRTAIFALDPEQTAAAEHVKSRAEAVLREKIVTPVLPAARFWPAEAYHQDYARRNPLRFDFYRRACGRDAGLRRLWNGRPMLAADP